MLSELLSWESKWVLLVWWKLLINVMYCCGIFWANWTGFWLFSENCWWMLLCIIVDYIGLTELGFGCLVKIVGDCALPMWNLVEIFLGSREEKINSWIVFTFLSGNFLKCVWSLWNLIAGGLISCTIDASGLWTKWNLHLSKTKGGYEVMVPILY